MCGWYVRDRVRLQRWCLRNVRHRRRRVLRGAVVQQRVRLSGRTGCWSVRAVRQRRTTMLRCQRLWGRVLRERHVHRGRFDVPCNRGHVYQRELRDVRRGWSIMLPRGARRRAAMHSGLRRMSQWPMRSLWRGWSTVLRRRLHGGRARLPGRQLRAVWRRWTALLRKQRVCKRVVYGGPRLWRVRGGRANVLRQRLLRQRPRVRRKRHM